ncbi:protein ORANGE-GREEN, chloroplastic-like [Rutidosis leptorrhynchoides]|uniref:protein ORANGE-GREEN, chloroplastic-like n=1 Tax=Rutidosis leptorrhynchoides TaxID=125765 RepID=UPI003A998CCC
MSPSSSDSDASMFSIDADLADKNAAGFCIIEGPETVQDFDKMDVQKIQDNIRSRLNKIFLHMEEVESSICILLIQFFMTNLLPASEDDPIVASFSGGVVGAISALMVVEINNVKHQEHKRCKYCLGTGYLACARCANTGSIVLIDPVASANGGNQPLSPPKTERCSNCSSAGKALELFRRQEVNFLIATNVATWGLDIIGVKTVIN